jgi:hypothetical protein
MKQSEKIQDKINTFQEAIDGGDLKQAEIDDFRKKIGELETKLATALAEEAQAEIDEEAARIAQEQADLLAQQQAEKDEKPKPKKKPEGLKKLTGENAEDCRQALENNGFKVTSAEERAKARKEATANTKKISTIVAEKVTGVFRSLFKKENIKKVDISKFETVKAKGVEFLNAIREASGGISDDNSEMVKRFRASVDELLEEAKKKQEDSEKPKE